MYFSQENSFLPLPSQISYVIELVIFLLQVGCDFIESSRGNVFPHAHAHFPFSSCGVKSTLICNRNFNCKRKITILN